MTTTGLPPAVDPWQGAGLPDATVVVSPPPPPAPPRRPRRRLAVLVAACGVAVVLVGTLVTVLLLTGPHGGAHGPGPGGTGALGALGHGGPDVGRRGAPIGTDPPLPSHSPAAAASTSGLPAGSSGASGTRASPSRTPTHPVATGPTVAPVYHSGYVDLSGLEAVDLETGATGGSAVLDVGLGYGSLNALHGSYFGDPFHGSGSGVSRSQCAGTAFTDNSVALSGLSAGDEVCVRTGAGHVGAIVVSYVQAGTSIGFGWTLWA